MSRVPGVNYWLKDKLLTQTEVGERTRYWLGAVTEVWEDRMMLSMR